jgi:Zn-dependent protease with chaperone function
VPILRHSPSYRYRWEIPALLLALFFMFYGTLWVFGLVGEIIIDTDTDWLLTLEDFGVTMLVGLFLLLGSILLIAWRARARLHRLQRSGVRASETQFAELYALSEACRRELGVTKPVDVYVVDTVPTGAPQVGTRGVWLPPYFLIITALQVNTRTPDELRFLLGREYGHVRHGHVPILTIIDTLGGSLGRVPLFGGFIQFIFAGWNRAATHTADRAGLLVVHDLNHVYSTLVKLVIGPALYDRIDHGALAAQVRQVRGRRHEEAILWFASPFDSTPLGRFEDMLKFSQSSLYRRLRSEALPEFAHQVHWEQ